MVSLAQVQASNALIRTALPAGLVAVFVGATSGIGETTFKTFAKYAQKPRLYLVGRSQSAADRIVSESKAINPEGEYIFLQSDVSLIRNVDTLIKEIKAKESAINLLFLSPGAPDFSRSLTSEGLHGLAVLNYYARIRVIQGLIPLVQQATALRRIVSVGGGGFEGKLDTSDFPGLQVPMTEIKEHLSTLVTLGLEAATKSAQTVSVVHAYPGSVKTPLLKDMPEEMLKNIIFVPIEESGERHVFVATSARFPPRADGSTLVPLVEGLEVSVGTDGKSPSGVYSVGETSDAASAETLEKLAASRADGLVEKVEAHTQGEFARIEGTYEN